VRPPSPAVTRKKWKLNLRRDENDNIDSLKVRSIKNSESLQSAPRSLRLLLPSTQNKRSMTQNWWNHAWLAQGRNEEEQGGAIPRAPPLSHYGDAKSLREAPTGPNDVTSTFSSVQYICFRKSSGSNMGAPNLLLAPGTI